MYLEIDGKGYELVSSTEEGIILDLKNPALPTIYAHPLISMEEVKTYIRQQTFRFPSIEKREITLEFMHMDLFDKKTAVKITRGNKFDCFEKGDMVYCQIKKNEIINEEKLQEKIAGKIFEQFILNRVSHWEEELGYLISQISFRKLRSSPYVVDKSEKSITFNKKNIALSKQMNDSLVFNSMDELLK